MAFQEITPQQLKDRLLSIFENKKEDIQNLNIEPCGFGCLSFYSKTGIQFQIKKDLSISEPEIILSSSSKTLKLSSSIDWLNKSLLDNYLRSWLVGHEIYSYNQHLKKNIQHIEAQNMALKRPDKPKLFDTKEEAYEVIRRKKINSTNFPERRKNDPELQKIPRQPQQKYKDWSWPEALGKPKRPHTSEFFDTKEEAYEVIQRKKINSITFPERRKDDPELKKIPKNPQQHYKDWSWPEAYGKPKFFDTKEEAYEVIRRKKVNSTNFLKRRKDDPELQKIPVQSRQHYEDWSWADAQGKPKRPKKSDFFNTKEEAYEVIQTKKVNSITFPERRKDDPELKKIPKNPQQHYKDWSWPEAYGKPKFFDTKEEAYEVIRRKKVNSITFPERRKNDPELQKIPRQPQQKYKDWSWPEALGKPKRPHTSEFFDTKEEAYEVIQRKKINSITFPERRKDDPELKKIPRNPQQHYKDWSWPEALGKPKFFDTKEEAYEVIRRKKVNSITFPERRKNDPELQKIPVQPRQHYEDWSWADAQGKPKRPKKSDFFNTKEEAYEVIQTKKVNSITFPERRKDDPELKKIPKNPQQHYKDWSWPEALGKPKFFDTKEEAYEVIRRKKVNSTNFLKRRKDDPELQKIPVQPRQHYEDWSWPEALGKPKRPHTSEFFNTKEEAYEVIQTKKVNSITFPERRKDDPELKKIPRNPHQHYKDWSWPEAQKK